MGRIKKKKSPYKACLTPILQRQTFADVGLGLFREGWTMQEIRIFVGKRGYKISERSLRRHLGCLKDGGKALYHESEARGRNPLLNDEQLELVIGFILHKNALNCPVTSKTVKDWIESSLKVSMTSQTVLNLFKRNDFSHRIMQTKKGGFAMTDASLAEVYLAWIQEYRDRIFPGVDHKNVCSFDFTFTSHRTANSTTFARKGVSQPKDSSGYTVYTNCVITCLWADGINHTPAMAFTLNPAFRTDRKITPLRKIQADH